MSMKTRSAFTVFHFWYQKMTFTFLFSYGSCPRPRDRTKRSTRTQTKIVCCFWLLQTIYIDEMKAGSTGPPVQLTPLFPTRFPKMFLKNGLDILHTITSKKYDNSV